MTFKEKIIQSRELLRQLLGKDKEEEIEQDFVEKLEQEKPIKSRSSSRSKK